MNAWPVLKTARRDGEASGLRRFFRLNPRPSSVKVGRQAIPRPPTLTLPHQQPALDQFREPPLDRRPWRTDQLLSFTGSDSP